MKRVCGIVLWFTCAAALAANKQIPAGEYAKLPLSFAANEGQTDSRVKFTALGTGYSLFLTGNEAVLSLSKKPKDGINPQTGVVRMQLQGARMGVAVAGEDELPGKVNYLLGNDPSQWHTKIPTYAKVKYWGVYPGVDLVYYGNQKQLEYDFVVAPNADAERIRLKFAGADKLSLDKSGNLRLPGTDGEVVLHKPVVYQIQNGQRQEVPGSFQLLTDNAVGFALGAYDKGCELVIDPVLAYSTYFGGIPSDGASSLNAIAADDWGHVYITGSTGDPNFPVTDGAYQTKIKGGNANAFVSELNAAGTGLIFSTYLGGTGNDWNFTEFPFGAGDTGLGIAVDAKGFVYVTGQTASYDFPVTNGAYQTKNKATSYVSSPVGNPTFGTNAFITKLNPEGSGLVYSTYLGGTGGHSQTLCEFQNPGDQICSQDLAVGIALDSDQNVCVTGTTQSSDFPVTLGVIETKNNPPSNNSLIPTKGFITKLNRAGSELIYSTYLNGSFPTAIATDWNWDAYITGYSQGGLPITSAAIGKSIPQGNQAPFVSEVNPRGTAYVYSTYLGQGERIPYTGSLFGGASIVVDDAQEAFVTGSVVNANYPVTEGAFQTKYPAGAQSAGFVTKLSQYGLKLLYSTFLGGSQTFPSGLQAQTSATSLAIDGKGNAYVAGWTSTADFPVTADGFQKHFAPDDNIAFYGTNAFLSALNTTGTGLLYSTYLGLNSTATSVAVDSANHAYVVGSVSGILPVTPESGFGKSATNFVAKFDFGFNAHIATTSTGTVNANPVLQGNQLIATIQVAPRSGSGVPTGKVQFYLPDLTNAATNPAQHTTVTLDKTGRASASFTTDALYFAGTGNAVYGLTTFYSGDAQYAPSSTVYFGQVAPDTRPAYIYADVGQYQSSPVGTPFPIPVGAYVEDRNGNYAVGAVVSFSGNGVSFSSPTATVGSNGIASVMATPTKVGSVSVNVTTANGLTGSISGLTGTAK